MSIEISVAIIALAFLALVIYLIAVAITLRQTLNHVNETLHEVRKQLNEEGGAKKIIENTGLISANLLEKMEALNTIFQSLANIGSYLETRTNYLKQEALASAIHNDRYSQSSFDGRDSTTAKISDAVELIWIGIKLWNKFNTRR